MSDPKSIILTGASRGIGLAIARYLLKEGHKVFLVARSEAPLEKLKDEFKGQVEFLGTDLSNFEVRCCGVSVEMMCCVLFLNEGSFPFERSAS
jgi:short-subunit dehydrogenase